MTDSEMAEQEAADARESLHASFESPPIGEYLRRQRVLRGMSAEELAHLTRIPLRSLERLESGRFDGETDGFARGFVRTVAEALGLDADDAISRMLSEPASAAWEQRSVGRPLGRAAIGLGVVVALALGLLGLRAAWQVVASEAGPGIAPTARIAAGSELVIWRDPVHALAEATGASLEPVADTESRSPNGPPADAPRPSDPR